MLLGLLKPDRVVRPLREEVALLIPHRADVVTERRLRQLRRSRIQALVPLSGSDSKPRITEDCRRTGAPLPGSIVS